MHSTFTKVVDPVCGMVIDRETAVAIVHDGTSYYFCEMACAETFRDEPERWLKGPDQDPFEHAH